MRQGLSFKTTPTCASIKIDKSCVNKITPTRLRRVRIHEYIVNEENMETLVVNFVGAPSSGKTTLAALVYGLLKLKGLAVEYVPEYAKHLVWTNQLDLLNNQHYVSKTQYDFMKAVNGQVQVIVTDGPLLAGMFYNEYNKENLSNVEKTGKLIQSWISDFHNRYFLVKRKHPYEVKGRVHTEEESEEIHKGIISLLNREGISYTECASTQVDVEMIVEKVLKSIDTGNLGLSLAKPVNPS